MDLSLTNLPEFKNETDRSIFISRISNAINDILYNKYNHNKVNFNINLLNETSINTDSNKTEDEVENITFSIEAQEPKFTLDQIVLEKKVLDELNYSIKFESVREKVYTEWGLSKIEPCPKMALNFHGESGTGKTMAAHGIANAMGRKIILASYAEIESKYHGDGPKNVKKLFQIASDKNAVLFIDEADSLLSKRLTNVTQGSEQAINSMRSQLLIQIEQFTGVVIFATNLATNYDSAFVTRIKSIYFKKPDLEMRKKLWKIMLLPELPLDEKINIDELALIEDICGRDIKNSVVKSAIKTAIDNEKFITQKVLENTLKEIIESNNEVTGESAEQGRELTEEEKMSFERKIRKKLKRRRYPK